MTNIEMVVYKSLQEMAGVEIQSEVFFLHDDNTLLITLSLGPLPLLSV